MNEQTRRLNEEALAHHRAGERLEAIDAWERLVPMLERALGDGAPDAAADLCRVLDRLCMCYRDIGRWDKARVAGRAALARAAEIRDVTMEILAAGHLGDVHLVRGEHDDAERHYARAADLAARHRLAAAGPGLARRRAELALAREEATLLAFARQAARLAEEENQTTEVARARALEAVALARRGRTAEVGPALDRAMEPLRADGAAGELAETRLLAAHAWLSAGRISEALEQATRVASYADEVGNVRLRISADAVIGRARAALQGESGDRKLDQLLQLTVAVTRVRDTAALLDTIADAALELLDADRAFVVLADGGEPEVASARARPGVEIGRPSASIVHRALAERREVVATDLLERGDLRAAQSVAAMGLLSVLCMPLVDGRDVVGAIYVDSQRASHQDFAEAIRYARALAANAAVAVTNARLLRAARDRAEQAAELAHDVFHPVNTMITLAALAKDAKDDPVWLDEIVRGITDLGRRVTTLSERFLEDREVTWVPFDVASLTRDLVAVHGYDARARGVVLDVVGDEEAWVSGDMDELMRALSNLLLDAIRRSPASETITVAITPQSDEVEWRVTLPPGSAPIAPEGDRPGPKPLSIARRILQAHGSTLATDDHAIRVGIPMVIGIEP